MQLKARIYRNITYWHIQLIRDDGVYYLTKNNYLNPPNEKPVKEERFSSAREAISLFKKNFKKVKLYKKTSFAYTYKIKDYNKFDKLKLL